MPEKVTIEECRGLLGNLANGKTDAQVQTWRDELIGVANHRFVHLQAQLRVDRGSAATNTAVFSYFQ